jgi:hypothetical protein
MSSDSEWVLVDSNLWILFLKEPSPLLRQLLKAERAMTHSCVIGEFLVGSIQYREMMRKFMCGLPKVGEVSLKIRLLLWKIIASGAKVCNGMICSSSLLPSSVE